MQRVQAHIGFVDFNKILDIFKDNNSQIQLSLYLVLCFELVLYTLTVAVETITTRGKCHTH